MAISNAQSELLVQALSMAANVAGQKLNAEANRQQMQLAMLRLEQERAMFDSKADLLRHLIGALIEKRLDAVTDGFRDILALYAEQARHFMAQQSKYADAELATMDALQSARLRKRLGEIDIELRSIRASARQLYGQMNEIVMRLGGDALSLSPDYYQALSLPTPRS